MLTLIRSSAKAKPIGATGQVYLLKTDQVKRGAKIQITDRRGTLLNFARVTSVHTNQDGTRTAHIRMVAQVQPIGTTGAILLPETEQVWQDDKIFITGEDDLIVNIARVTSIEHTAGGARLAHVLMTA